MRQGLVRAHNRSESCYAVNSLTSTPIYDVDIESWSCQCERYLRYTLCAVLGVLYAVGSLGWSLNRWTEPALDTIFSKKLRPSGTGKKPGKQRAQPPTSKRTQLDRSKFADAIHLPSADDENEVKFVWLADHSRVFRCHGCNRCRDSSCALGSRCLKKLFRVYPNEGSMCFQATPNPAYFHLKESCCLLAGVEVTSDNHEIVKPFLKEFTKSI